MGDSGRLARKIGALDRATGGAVRRAAREIYVDECAEMPTAHFERAAETLRGITPEAFNHAIGEGETRPIIEARFTVKEDASERGGPDDRA